MDRQPELQQMLEEALGSHNVYYEPPESLKMRYPCIRYSKSRIRGRYANNGAYSFDRSYELIVISKQPEHPVVEKLLQFPYCSHERHYVADNLHHDSFTIYF